MTKVAILGAGLTGLSAAYHLEQSGRDVEISIFEKEPKAGGLLRSVFQNGFTFDYTGHLLHFSDPYFSSFVDTIVGFDSLYEHRRKTFIYSQNTYTPYPFQMHLYGLPTETIIECIEGFIARPSSPQTPTSFYDWVLAHFGTGMGKHFFFPYNSKLLAYDITKIHPSWTGRFVPQTSLTQILRGSLQPADYSSAGYNSTFFYPKFGGIQHLIDGLKKRLTSSIQTNHTAVEINVTQKVITFENGSKSHYDYLISTVPLNKLLPQLRGTGTEGIAAMADHLLCNTVVNVNIGTSLPALSDKHWIYYPEPQYAFYRAGFWNNFTPHASPNGHSSLYAEWAFMPGTCSRSEQQRIVDRCVQQLCELFAITPTSITTTIVLTLEHAYVVYDQWRENNLERLLADLDDFFLCSTGRFGAWKYSSMQEAVLDGKIAAEKALGHFAARSPIIQHTTSSGMSP